MTTSSQSPFEFVPYEALGESPNIIVDGAPNDFTVLTLSHWPKSGTPIEPQARYLCRNSIRLSRYTDVPPQCRRHL
jgi:hypothetical protein